MMKKISMKLTALALALTLLWGMLPAPGRAQAAQPAEQRYVELIAGTEAAFLLAFNGGVYPLNKDNEPADAPAASLDTETQYPFVWGEALWIVDKGKGDSRQLYPEGNADSAFALNDDFCNRTFPRTGGTQKNDSHRTTSEKNRLAFFMSAQELRLNIFTFSMTRKREFQKL